MVFLYRNAYMLNFSLSDFLFEELLYLFIFDLRRFVGSLFGTIDTVYVSSLLDSIGQYIKY